MIQAVNAGFTYEGSDKPALNSIDTSIPVGSIYGIAGSAGSGKSTFAMCLNGAIPHCIEGELTGKILLDGGDISETPLDVLSSIVGSVFQDVESQIVSSVVEDEIVFGMENLGFAREEMEERIVESLSAVGISNIRYAEIDNLSGGQKQRVAIAAALALRPRLLVMDEPTSELDPQGSIELFDVLNRLNKEKGITIIVIEQKLDLLVKYCNRIGIMDQGSIVFEGTNRDILRETNQLERIGLQIPPFARLFHLLSEAGIYDSVMPVSEVEAIRFIEELLLKEGESHERQSE